MNEIDDLLTEYKHAKDVMKKIEKETNLVVERKIQQTSGGTYFVCLPKEWANKVELKKGSQVILLWNKNDTITLSI